MDIEKNNPQIIAGFRKHFPLAKNWFLDAVVASITGKYVLDIIAMDAWLETQHEEYADPSSQESMSDLIGRVYGAEALAFIKEIL